MGNEFTELHELPSHTPGTPKGEEQLMNLGKEPGRDEHGKKRTARDSTSVNTKNQSPIDPKMPHFPPA